MDIDMGPLFEKLAEYNAVHGICPKHAIHLRHAVIKMDKWGCLHIASAFGSGFAQFEEDIEAFLDSCMFRDGNKCDLYAGWFVIVAADTEYLEAYTREE